MKAIIDGRVFLFFISVSCKALKLKPYLQCVLSSMQIMLPQFSIPGSTFAYYTTYLLKSGSLDKMWYRFDVQKCTPSTRSIELKEASICLYPSTVCDTDCGYKERGPLVPFLATETPTRNRNSSSLNQNYFFIVAMLVVGWRLGHCQQRELCISPACLYGHRKGAASDRYVKVPVLDWTIEGIMGTLL